MGFIFMHATPFLRPLPTRVLMIIFSQRSCLVLLDSNMLALDLCLTAFSVKTKNTLLQ